MDYAYAKFQSIEGDDYYVRKLPILLTSKAKKAHFKDKYGLQCLGLTAARNNELHGAVYYDTDHKRFRLIAFGDIIVNGLKAPRISSDKVLNTSMLHSRSVTLSDDEAIYLDDLSQLIIQKQSENNSHGECDIFYFVVPNMNIQKFEPRVTVEKHPQPAKGKNVVDKNLLNRWTADDRQQLKKLILQYGYGRWKQLQRSSTLIGGKLQTKSYQQIKAFANSFIRSLGQSLPEEQTELKIFLQNLIEQAPDDLYLQPNQKDWDQQILLSQRSVQYTKRLQLLNRVKTLVKKFKDEALKSCPEGEKVKGIYESKIVNWEGLLNFIPNALLYGQRPAIWWVKKHDIDLILGVYKYGYANYSAIKAAREYCFAELDKADKFNDFPSADNLTRRLKKLMQTINKIEMNEGKIDFQDEGSSEEQEKNWSESEKRILFKLLTDFGIPLTADGRSNWTDIRDRMKGLVKDFTKNIGQIEKMVSKIRFNCQEILPEDPKPVGTVNDGRFTISRQAALKFSTNLNMLSFIRKSVMSNEQEMFHSSIEDIKQKHMELKPTDAAYIDNYDPAVSDLNLIVYVAKNGLISCSNPKLNEQKVFSRIEWLCEVFNQIKDKNNDRKKKYKNWGDQPKKRTKFQLNRDKQGNIVFPININPSLKLMAIGRICSLPNYHSEHNLFPIGYISVRMHASMFTKGVRCNYTCEIIEGDGKPIYKVTSEEEPQRPIVRDSSTGCWVYICQRVNQLQQVKKEKVTISGTERFGLLEPNVVRLLEDLHESDKCIKYKFKYKQIGEGQADDAV